MHKLIACLAVLIATTLPAPAAAQSGPGGAFGGQLFQGSVPEFGATISGARVFITGASGFGVEAMFEMQGGLLDNLVNDEVEEYAAFNAQLGLLQRFVGDGNQSLIPYVSAGWYPAFERIGDEIFSYSGLWYANGGAELVLFGSMGVFAEAGLGFSANSMPLILRFGISGT